MRVAPRDAARIAIALCLPLVGVAGCEEEPPSEICAPIVGEPAPGSIFLDATDALGLPTLMDATASLVDVDGDGWLDLLVGGHTEMENGLTELYRNRGCEGGFEAMNLTSRVDGEPLVDHVVSTSAIDLNGDGYAELLLGSSTQGQLQILWSRGELQYEARTVTSSDLHPGSMVTSVELLDLDGDAVLDLFASHKFPSAHISTAERTHPNIVLKGLGDEAFEDITDQLPDILDCGKKQTFASQRIPRAPFGATDILYIANDFTTDCIAWLPRTDGLTPATPIDGGEAVIQPARFSMGVDHLLEPDTGDPLIFVSGLGANYMFSVLGDEVVNRTDLLPSPKYSYVWWGGTFFDADNDGDEDLVVAAGLAFQHDSLALVMRQMFPGIEPVTENRLFYFERQPDGSFVDASAEAGRWFADDPAEWYGIGSGDINRDGCVDIAATPREVLPSFDFVGFDGDPDPDFVHHEIVLDGPGVRILLNTCPKPKNRWIGFEVQDIPGSIVALELDDGHTLYDSVKGLEGVGARSGGGLIHFGLGAERTAVEATLFSPSGDVLGTLKAPESGAYHPLGS